jgi:hypothetical protein
LWEIYNALSHKSESSCTMMDTLSCILFHFKALIVIVE